MSHNPQDLKQRLSLLDYLQRHSWKSRPKGAHEEFIGLCPLHPESRPSFYVSAVKNVFYCHGCHRGGDLIRFVQLSLNLSFHETIIHLNNELGSKPEEDEVLRETAGFYQRQLDGRSEAWDYLHSRGLHYLRLIRQLKIGYAPGGILRRHLTSMGYSFGLLLQLGLIDQRGHDAFYRRIIFPCFDGSRFSNLYGRSIDRSAPHRFLPRRPKGGLFAWGTVATSPEAILVEGLFDLAVLWQAGFVNTTCSFGTHLTQAQFLQLSDNPNRTVFIAFDSDPNGAEQSAAYSLAQRLRSVGLKACIVDLPDGQDPNNYFVSGAMSSDFDKRLHRARSL